MTGKGYLRGFFIFLSLFLLFWFWIFISLLSGQSPKSTVSRLFSPRPNEKPLIEPSFYERQAWVEDILPDATSRDSLARNGNRVSIRFAQPMDTGYAALTSHSVSWEGDVPIDFSRKEWTDDYTFVLSVNRPLLKGESMTLVYEFRTRLAQTLPRVVLNYE